MWDNSPERACGDISPAQRRIQEVTLKTPLLRLPFAALTIAILALAGACAMTDDGGSEPTITNPAEGDAPGAGSVGTPGGAVADGDEPVSSDGDGTDSHDDPGGPDGGGSSGNQGDLRVFFYTLDQQHDCTWPPGQSRYELRNFGGDPLSVGVAWDEVSHAGYYEVGFTVEWGDGSPPITAGDPRLEPPEGWGPQGPGVLFDAYVEHQYAPEPAIYTARISYDGTAWGVVGTDDPGQEWTHRSDAQSCSGYIELHVEATEN